MLAMSAPVEKQQDAKRGFIIRMRCCQLTVYSFLQTPSGLIRKHVNTAESWGELGQALRIEMSRLAQLQDLQMLFKDLLSFLRGDVRRHRVDRTVVRMNASG